MASALKNDLTAISQNKFKTLSCENLNKFAQEV